MRFPPALLVSVRGHNIHLILLLSEKTDNAQLLKQQLLREPLIGFYFSCCFLLPQKNIGTPLRAHPTVSSGKRDVLLPGQTPNALTDWFDHREGRLTWMDTESVSLPPLSLSSPEVVLSGFLGEG